MGTPAAGAVVLVRFPFSDLTRTKLRPAIVLADAGRGDTVLCQVTSKSYGDDRAVTIETFTANESITTTIATLRPESLTRVVDGATGPG